MSPGTAEPKTVTETEKEQAILGAALELFAKRGYDATPVPHIAEKAGVGAGTIYRYFDSKEALLNVLYRRWKRSFMEVISAGYPAESSAREQFRFLFNGMVQFAQKHPSAFEFLEFHHHTPNLDDRSKKTADEINGFLYAFLQSGIDRGNIRPLPHEVILSLVLGFFTALVKVERSGQLNLTADILADVEDCCWRAISS